MDNVTTNVTNSGFMINNGIPNGSKNGSMPNLMYDPGMNQFMQTAQQNPFHQNQFNAFESNIQFTFLQNQLGTHALNPMNTLLPP